MVKCPYDSTEAIETTRQWNYGKFLVKLYKCPRCGSGFKAYFTPEGKLSHTIPKPKH